MRSLKILESFAAFLIVFSFAAFPGFQTSELRGPSPIQFNPAPAESWYPAGPAMDHLFVPIFVDGTAESVALTAAPPQIDFMDSPLASVQVAALTPNPNYYVTQPMLKHGDVEIQFNLANNLWGCNMNFGNAGCGIDIRQGIAHLIDKNIFTAITSAATLPKDDPEPASHLVGGLDNGANNGGLPTANPCGWDQLYPEPPTAVGPCQVGAPGGTAYHLAHATGANVAWQPKLTDPDFCAAAGHFINAGLAGGTVGYGPGVPAAAACNAGGLNGALVGIPAAVGANTVTFFIQNSDPDILNLGNGLAEEICALFTGVFVAPCAPFLNVNRVPSSALPGPQTSPVNPPNLGWGMETADLGNEWPFDASLYYAYNSAFVSGIPAVKPPNGPCSASAVPSSRAENYIYNCNPNFDVFTTSMEYSPCITFAGDPTVGQVNPTFTNCPSTTKLTSISAGYQAEDLFGAHEITIPVYTKDMQFGYLSNWSRVINGEGVGVPNFFTRLNAFTANPAVAGTIREGSTQTTSLNPYAATTVSDFNILSGIFDTLAIENPVDNGQLLCWMCTSLAQLQNNQLTYAPPAGTVVTYRFTLRNDILFQDGKPLTPFDVAFSYLTLKAAGAFQSSGLFPVLGMTVVSRSQFDININGFGPFTQEFLTATIPGSMDPGPTVLPGRYWSTQSCGGFAGCLGGGQVWDNAVIACFNTPAACFPSTYSPLGVCAGPCAFPGGFMTVPAALTSPLFDPLAAGILIGSGPWVCRSPAGVLGQGCSSTGAENPPPGQSYSFSRYGLGTTPGGTLNTYFRSSGNLALWTWSGDTGDFNKDFLNFANIAGCFGQPLLPLGAVGCGLWQQGIGAPNGHAIVGVAQVGVVLRFVAVNWISPYNWKVSPPTGIAPFAPILYDGISTGNPGNPFAAGVSQTLNPASVAGCAAAYSIGGYDC